MPEVCAIDFGTSNSAIALPSASGVKLVELEPGHATMPTAAFYSVEGLAGHEEAVVHYGRAAVAAYVDGHEGRLMRSMKSILGFSLATQATEVGSGRSVRYLDVVGGYLRHLKQLAERDAGHQLTRLVLGRPVFFVDDDPKHDAQAQSALAQAAHNVGFADVRFQFEPIAAALDYESTADREQIVLVADIGGGTSDFSLVRVGPRQRQRVERKDDILANHGVHIAGTDFDRQLELRSILPHCGFQALGPRGREVPSKVYFDLATWHLINTVYSPGRVAELKQMASFYADPKHHARLMTVVRHRLGHALIAKAEAAKIAVAEIAELAEVPQSAKPAFANAHLDKAIDWAKPQPRPAHTIDLGVLEHGLQALVHENDLLAALGNDMDRIAAAAGQTLIQAGLARDKVNALYFTGGSTGLTALAARIAGQFPAAKIMRGDRFDSVATGLGIHAQRVFA